MKRFLVAWMLMSPVSASLPDDAQARSDEAGVQLLKPAWKVGDTWRIETTTPRIGAGYKSDDVGKTKIRWKFHVEGTEVVSQHDCFRVSVRCLTQAGRQPSVVFWADRNSFALVRVQAKIPSRDGYFTVSESYQFLGDQPTPVIGPFSALPIDLPSFRVGNSKSIDDFYYEAIPGPVGAKAVGDVGFLFRIKQSVRTGADVANDARAYTKSVNHAPLTEVNMRNHAVSVRQFWRAQSPWPVISTNGWTISRLLPADEKEESKIGN